jgi:hypothetical protein
MGYLFGQEASRVYEDLNKLIDIKKLGAFVDAIGEAKAIANSTSDKEYRKLMRNVNCTSYSKLSLLHKCPRLLELEAFRAAAEVPIQDDVVFNIDFAFGHAIGSGLQTILATGSLQAGIFSAMLAWHGPLDEEKLDARGNPTGKSLAWAVHALEKFDFFYQTSELAEYEILRLPSGRPAVELSFAVDTSNGFFHFGHIDAVLIHKTLKRLAVWEGKTTGLANISEAAYGNSYQALGYSVVVDAISKEFNLPTADYEVFYVVYSTKAREFQLLPFPKSKTQRAEWLQDLLLSHAMISKYQELKFFPKRGDSCIDKYGKQCKWYGTCSISNEGLFPTLEKLPLAASIEGLKAVDFKFTLAELVAAQKA